MKRREEKLTLSIDVEVVWEGSYVTTDNLLNAQIVAQRVIDEEISDYLGESITANDLARWIVRWSDLAQRRIVEDQWPDEDYKELCLDARPAVLVSLNIEGNM